jgi:hypothetical protein
MKKIRFILLIGLVIALININPSNTVKAQMFSSYTSSLTVQNLSTTDASVEIVYYYGGEGGNAGDEAGNTTETLGKFEVADYAALPVSSFQGSVVISSNQPLGAVSLLNGSNKGRGMYTGMSAGALEVVLPFMMHNWGASSWNTYFSVQNVHSTEDAVVTINYRSCSGSVNDTVTIKPNAMKIVDQADEACMTGKVITSAVLTSDQPIAVVVSQESTSVNSALVSNGYINGSAYPLIPLVNSNNPTPTAWRTAIALFNMSSQNTTVTMEYTRKDGFKCEETRTINANSATEFGGNAFILGDSALTCPTGERFIGAARVKTNTSGVELVATVNQDRGTLASAYSSFNPEDATPRIGFPRFVNRFGGAQDWDSTFTVMNVGSSAVYVKCEYLNASYESQLGLIEPNGVKEDLPRYNLPENYSGGAVCTAYSNSSYTNIATDAGIVGIVNTRGHGVGYNDLMMTYEGVNVGIVD